MCDKFLKKPRRISFHAVKTQKKILDGRETSDTKQAICTILEMNEKTA